MWFTVSLKLMWFTASLKSKWFHFRTICYFDVIQAVCGLVEPLVHVTAKPRLNGLTVSTVRFGSVQVWVFVNGSVRFQQSKNRGLNGLTVYVLLLLLFFTIFKNNLKINKNKNVFKQSFHFHTLFSHFGKFFKF